MLLDDYLRQTVESPEDILEKVKLEKVDVASWQVIQYPDELIFELSKRLEKNASQIFFELLHLESPGQIRQTASDYSLLLAIENEALYIYIPKNYRIEQTKFLSEIFIHFEIFELEFHPMARFNVIGREIYKAFLSGLNKSEEFKQIQNKLRHYFILVHDKTGTVLCHQTFNRSAH